MNTATFDANNAQKLLDLQIRWQMLISERIQAKPGTPLRYQLDLVYHRTLPIIMEITDAINDEEIERLIKLANIKLREVPGADQYSISNEIVIKGVEK